MPKLHNWTNIYHRGSEFYTLEICKVLISTSKVVEKYLVKFDPSEELMDLIQLHHWRIDRHGQPACWFSDGKNTYIGLHRYIMDPAEDQYVSNKNKDLLDLRSENLSVCGNMSCVMLHSIRRTFGWRLSFYDGWWYVYFQLFKGESESVSVYSCQSKNKCENIRQKLKNGELNPNKLLIQECIGDKLHSRKKGNHIYSRKEADGRIYYRAHWKGKYLGAGYDYQKMINLRNSAIKKWANAIDFKE